MPDSLHELFHPDAMGALVERYADQFEEASFIGVYEEGETIQANVDGTFKFEEQRFSRDLAPIAGLDSPSTAAPKLKRTVKTGQVFVIQEHTDMPARYLEGLRAPGAEGANAPLVVRNHLRNLTGKVVRTKNYWAAKSMLTQGGAVDLSAFPNSELASGTLTYPVKDIDASASWATPTTKIRSSEINALKKTYSQAAGFRGRRAIASSAVEGYLTGNTEISNFIAGGALAGAILGRSFEERGVGDVIDFGGLQWAFVEDYYALDSAEDTPVDVNADNDVFAVLPGPERSGDVFAVAEGVQYVPAGPMVGDVLGAPGNVLRPIRGMGAYVELTMAPVGLRLYVFWTGCLVQKYPNAVGVVDASPS
jgi:hypothetical protein